MNAVDGGVVDVDAAFEEIIDSCLGCRACEPVCPGMVPYARALEGTRAEIVAQRPSLSHRLRATLLGSVIGSRQTLRFGTALLSLAQGLKLMRLSPRRFKRLSSGLRDLDQRPRASVGYRGKGGSLGRVALLAGCIQDEWFRPVNEAAIQLLELAGYEVHVPEAQTCCGALAAHDGKALAARSLATKNEKAFAGFDLVVATSAGCSAHLAEYEHWVDSSDSLASRSKDVVVVIAEAIEKGLLPAVTSTGAKIAIQDPCHLRHAQRIVAEPRAILEVAGYDVVEIDPNGMCCGAAGLYTVLQPAASARLGNQKADQVRSTGMTRVASANPGCEMQMRSALGDDYEIAHPIEWYLAAINDLGNVDSVEGLG
jgi:glycolate oxidase iron-sulfur subunit